MAKKFSVMAIADDPYCKAELTFEADSAEITEVFNNLIPRDNISGGILLITSNGIQIAIKTSEAFYKLVEV